MVKSESSVSSRGRERKQRKFFGENVTSYSVPTATTNASPLANFSGAGGPTHANNATTATITESQQEQEESSPPRVSSSRRSGRAPRTTTRFGDYLQADDEDFKKSLRQKSSKIKQKTVPNGSNIEDKL